MVTTLFLIRHGETEGSDIHRYKGSINVPLSEKGQRQMAEASAFLRRYLGNSASSKYMSYLRDVQDSTDMHSGFNPDDTKLAAVYCSHLRRALKSAEIIAAPYGLAPVELSDLRERNFGKWEGMSFTEIKEQYPEEFGEWARNPLKYSPVDGENTIDVERRVLQALERILTDHEGDHVAIVGHGGVNRIFLCRFLGMPLENLFRIEQDYAAVNVIEFWDANPVIKLMNGR